MTSSLLPAGLPLSSATAQAQSSPSRAKEFIAILDFEAKGSISKAASATPPQEDVL